MKNIKKKLKKEILKDTSKISGIYKIVNKVNGKYYIGSSEDIERRWIRCHRKCLRGGYHRNIHFQRSWNKCGENNFELIIVEIVNPIREILLNVEQKYLDTASRERNKSYNLTFVAGGGNLGKEVSKKISLSLKGKTVPLERREKIKNSTLGKKNHFYGKHHTEEQKKKWSLIFKKRGLWAGSKNPTHDNTIYNFKNILTKERFSGTQFELRNKYSLGSGLWAVIHKKRPHYKNWCLV